MGEHVKEGEELSAGFTRRCTSRMLMASSLADPSLHTLLVITVIMGRVASSREHGMHGEEKQVKRDELYCPSMSVKGDTKKKSAQRTGAGGRERERQDKEIRVLHRAVNDGTGEKRITCEFITYLLPSLLQKSQVYCQLISVDC